MGNFRQGKVVAPFHLVAPSPLDMEEARSLLGTPLEVQLGYWERQGPLGQQRAEMAAAV